MLESLLTKVPGLTLFKRDFNTGASTLVFSCEFYEIFTSSFFYRTPLVAAFVSLIKSLFSNEHLPIEGIGSKT